METLKKKKPITFEFYIQDFEGILQMKNIPPSALPNYRGLPSEDLDTFLLNFMSFAEAMTIILMPINLNCFPLP
jgi:hypothetical protein